MNGVRITYKWSQRYRAYYIDSCAGLLTFRPRGEDLTRFRDKYINQVKLLADRAEKGEDCAGEIFRLYREIRAEYRGVRYKANLRTRVRYCFSRR